jgi:S-DNA-T family DNA segregation ATPase FtsK/SpoIIIE
VDAASLARDHRLASGEPRLSLGERWLLPLGLADRPAQQVQEPLLWDLRAPGHWGFAGASATGRSSALRTIAGHLASALGPTEVHLYAVGSGSLGPLTTLPHTGAAVDGADVARIERLVSRLTDEVSRRRAELARRHYSSTAEWLGADPTTAPPLMVLLVDDWEQLAGRLDTSDHGVLTDRLLSLLRDGTSAGLRAAFAGGRGLLTGRISTHLSHKALLRPSDPMDATLVGLPASVLPNHQPPGRAILADGTEAQLAVHGDGSVAAWGSWLAARAAMTRTVDMPSARRPLRVDALPVTIRRSELPSVPPGSLALGVGVGGGELSPAVLEPERDGRQILIAGPPRGGKSTALLALAEALLAAGHPTAVVTSRPDRWTCCARADDSPPGVVPGSPLPSSRRAPNTLHWRCWSTTPNGCSTAWATASCKRSPSWSTATTGSSSVPPRPSTSPPSSAAWQLRSRAVRPACFSVRAAGGTAMCSASALDPILKRHREGDCG